MRSLVQASPNASVRICKRICTDGTPQQAKLAVVALAAVCSDTTEAKCKTLLKVRNPQRFRIRM